MENDRLKLFQGQKERKVRILDKENYNLISLFFISAICVYYAPVIITKLFFLALLLFYYQSKKNYFWIAFVFILINCPAGFFSGDLATDTQRVPIYTFSAGFSVSFFDLFYIFSIVKAFKIKKNILNYYFNDSLRLILGYGLVLLLYSIILGMSQKNLIMIGRTTILPFLFFLILPTLIFDSELFIKFIKLILPFTFLSFIGQIYEISYGQYLISIIKIGSSTIVESGIAIAEGSEEVSRVFDAYYLNTLSIIFCSFFLIRGNSNFKPLYLIIIIFCNFIICFTSATRGSFLSYSIILLTAIIIILFSSTINSKYLKYAFITFVVILIGTSILQTSNVLLTQLQRSSDRLKTITFLFSGDVMLGGQNRRVEERIPKIMKSIKESPIIGTGFSENGLSYADGHIGFHDMLREGGIVELIIFSIFFIQISKSLWKLSKRAGIHINEKNSLVFISIAFLSLLATHSTSSQLFGYYIGAEKWFMVSLILVGYNVFFKLTASDINNRSMKRMV